MAYINENCCNELYGSPSPFCSFKPASSDVWIGKEDCVVQVDIQTEPPKGTVIWGNVLDCSKNPVIGGLVQILRYECDCCCELNCVGYTYTDCNGYYQFELPKGCMGRYRIVVNRCLCRAELQKRQNNICYL